MTKHKNPQRREIAEISYVSKVFRNNIKNLLTFCFLSGTFSFFSMMEKGQEEGKGLTVLGHHTTRVFSDVKALIPALKLLKKNIDPFPDPILQ